MKTIELYSIGYGNRKIDVFIELLKKHNVEVLIDIRSNPRSRFNPYYNRQRLKDALEANGIEYEFMGEELGGKPKDESLYINGEVSYPLVWESQNFKDGIKTLLQKGQTGKRLCIMCCELHPEHCHRKTMVGEYLITTQGTSTFHINGIGEVDNQLF